MQIVEDSLFFDLECTDASTVFAMGAAFRTHTPLHARNAEAVKKLLPTLQNWGNAVFEAYSYPINVARASSSQKHIANTGKGV